MKNMQSVEKAENYSMTIFAASTADANAIAEIVSLSNKDVAVKFGITKENNPKHPCFYDEAWALSDFERGEEYFLYDINGENAGCVAFEQPNPEVGYLNRLSVLPAENDRWLSFAIRGYPYGRNGSSAKIPLEKRMHYDFK